jgi:uncharacterized protein (DUF362 family)
MSCDLVRRRLLSNVALLIGAGLGVENAVCDPKKKRAFARTSKVVRARRSSVIGDSNERVDVAILRDMLGKAVCSAMGTQQTISAFRHLFRSTDVVAIKVNTLAGRGLSTHPELVRILAEWLEEAGIGANNIVVMDRSDRELELAGFKLNRLHSGVRCLGTNDDYDWTPREWGDGSSCFSRLLVTDVTALINVGVIKDHDLSGISAGMKNLYGFIHNPNKYHDRGCSPYVAQLAAFPLIRDKLRLTILDGLIAQCHGGPARCPRWVWPWGGVLVSTDPVAIDAVAWKLIEERRQALSLKSLTDEGRTPKWLTVAEQLGLGEASVDRITLVDV